MTPLADDVDKPLIHQWTQTTKRLVKDLRREAVASEAGVDLDVDARTASDPAGGGPHGVDAIQRPDGDVDVVDDEIIKGNPVAVVYPREDAASVRSDPGTAQQKGLGGLRRSQPGRAARERGKRGGDEAMPVRVGFDHSHHRRAAAVIADAHLDQSTHIVTHRSKIDDRLPRIGPQGLIVMLPPLRGGEIRLDTR